MARRSKATRQVVQAVTIIGQFKESRTALSCATDKLNLNKRLVLWERFRLGEALGQEIRGVLGVGSTVLGSYLFRGGFRMRGTQTSYVSTCFVLEAVHRLGVRQRRPSLILTTVPKSQVRKVPRNIWHPAGTDGCRVL